MKNPNVARNAEELAELLGLPRAYGLEWQIRSELNSKIIEVVKKKKLTHAQVAKLADTSRTRITALLNRNRESVSVDLMLRILGALGVQAKIQFRTKAA